MAKKVGPRLRELITTDIGSQDVGSRNQRTIPVQVVLFYASIIFQLYDKRKMQAKKAHET